MPWRICLFCGEVKHTSIFFQVCHECWQAEQETGGDVYARMDAEIERQGLVAPPGSLVYRPQDFVPMHSPKIRRGEEHPNAKLTRPQIDAYRERHAAGESYRKLAKEAGLDHETIRSALTGRTYRRES